MTQQTVPGRSLIIIIIRRIIEALIQSLHKTLSRGAQDRMISDPPVVRDAHDRYTPSSYVGYILFSSG